MNESGLYVVATPIGNLEDMTLRAIRVLSEVDCILAEDTRQTRKLLQQHGIRTAMSSLHENNEEREIPALLERLRAGQSLALVSDAGTPLVSDPGFRLVAAARAAGLPVFAVPGPSAVTAALSVAGLPTDRFAFEGFLAARPSARRAQLEILRGEARTLVFFESSHRILDCLGDMATILGAGRRAAVCRELTKRFETVLEGSLAELAERLGIDSDQQRGEFVVLVEGQPEMPVASLDSALAIARALLEFLPASQAARAAAKLSGVSRREIFRALDHDGS